MFFVSNMNKKANIPLQSYTSSLRGRQKVFAGLSGGVDSSVAAALLKEQGFDVTGIHLKCFNLDGCAERDADDARRVAETLNIPFYVFDFENEYKDRVVNYMVGGYRRGITPNPDVMCNKEIKFGLFMRRARELGADYIATGHYVRLIKYNISKDVIVRNPAAGGLGGFDILWSGATSKPRRREDKRSPPLERTERVEDHYIFALKTAKDVNKDQSYFLWTLTQEQLKYCLFPIGDYKKSAVRAMAKQYGLPTAEKKDSQGICFLGKVKLANFLKQYIPARAGVIMTAEGKKIGAHDGAHAYTPGQRHGLYVGGMKHPVYVTSTDITENTVTVAERDPATETKMIALANVNIIGAQPKKETPVMARIRYREPLAPARLIHQFNGKYILMFAAPRQFIAPGQSAVFYTHTGEMIGGGIIV